MITRKMIDTLDYQTKDIGIKRIRSSLANAPELRTNVRDLFPMISLLEGLGYTHTVLGDTGYTLITHGDYGNFDLRDLAEDAVSVVEAVNNQGGDLLADLSAISTPYVSEGAKLIRGGGIESKIWTPCPNDTLIASLADAGFAYQTQKPIDERQEISVGVTGDDLYGKNHVPIDPIGLLVDEAMQYFQNNPDQVTYDPRNVWKGVEAAIAGAIPIREYSRTNKNLELVNDWAIVKISDIDKYINGDRSVIIEELPPQLMTITSKKNERKKNRSKGIRTFPKGKTFDNRYSSSDPKPERD